MDKLHEIISVSLIVAVAVTAAYADSLKSSHSDKSFGHDGGHDSFQKWYDWYSKRSFGHNKSFGKDDPETLQKWHEFLAKRGSFDSNGKSFGKQSPDDLQSWNAWMSKRGFGPDSTNGFGKGISDHYQKWLLKRGTAFGSQAFGKTDPETLQKWNDWWSKRNFEYNQESPLKRSKRSFSSAQLGFGQGKNPNLQKWQEWLVKRDFGSSQGFGVPEAPKLQSWRDWLTKRGFGESNYDLGSYLDDYARYMKWDNLANGISKRQLRSFSPNFGSYRKYFTDGLQDWSTTFSGTKRQPSKH